MDNDNHSDGHEATGRDPGRELDDTTLENTTLLGLSNAALQMTDAICGRYRRVELLGRGAFGSVWKCHDQVTGIDVAIKQVPSSLVRDAAQAESIRRNFQAVERLHHPHIAAAKTLEVDPDTGEYYLVMEYVKGMELNHLLSMRGNRMTLDEVVGIARQIASALDYCHGHGIVHRDIKPSNVMVDMKGTVKVLDFGLAAGFQTTMVGLEEKSDSVITGGTLCFMPPEQWKGLAIDGRTDQYALAATMYKLLSGKAPFEGAPSAAALMAAVEHQPAPPIEGLAPRVWAAMERALAKERKQRFATCMAFVDACEGIAPGASFRMKLSRLAGVGAVCMLLAAAGLRVANARRGAGEGQVHSPSQPLVVQPLGLTYHALVIGIDDYPDGEGWPDLENARNDAEDLATVLHDRYGFQDIEILLDQEATRARILEKTETLALSLDATDALVVFFAGHGEYSPELNEGYWIPVDGAGRETGAQARAGWIKNLEIASLLGASDARHVLVIADSCFAGSLSRGTPPSTSAMATNRAERYSAMLNRSSQSVIASGAYWEKVYDAGVSNSPFTKLLLEALEQNTNRWMSAFELAEAVRTPYLEHTGNRITFGSLLRPGSGQFVFECGAAEPGEALELVADPGSALPDHPIVDYAALTRSGRTNAADRLLRKLPEEFPGHGLLESVAHLFDPSAAQAQRKRLDELILYLRNNPGENDPQLQAALGVFARPRILVVLGPDDQTHSQYGSIEETLWRSGLTEFIRSADGIRVFDRTHLDDTLFEIKLSTARVSDERARSLVGKILPASLLITGESFTEGTTSRVFLRLLAAESAEVLGAFEFTVEDPDRLAAQIETAAAALHARALSARPLQAKIVQADGDRLQAGVGWFHGAHAQSRFELLRRVRQDHVLFEEFREQRVGTARVGYLGENTVDLEPEWTEPVGKEEYESLWVRELTAGEGD